jgi:hypothetical protein
MKKILTTLLTLSFLTASFPAHSMDSAYNWTEKNIYTLIGVSVAAIAAIAAYLAYKNQTITVDGPSMTIDRMDKNTHLEKTYPGDVYIKPSQKDIIEITTKITAPRTTANEALRLLKILKGTSDSHSALLFIQHHNVGIEETYYVPCADRTTQIKKLSIKHNDPNGKIYIDQGDSFAIDLSLCTQGKAGETPNVFVKHKNESHFYSCSPKLKLTAGNPV